MVGTTLDGRYEIGDKLGRGGMSVVYRASDTLLGRMVAVKALPAELQAGDLPQRFLQEARVMARLAHPAIVVVHDVGKSEGVPYFVMEFVEGEPLFPALREKSLDEALEIIVHVCHALEHAHSRGVVHRDIKPANVLLAAQNTVKLTDFGLARVMGVDRVSQSGAFIGTVSYMAPEQIMGSDADGRADLYALGVLLYELVCGRQPFTGNDAVAILSQHLHVNPVAPRVLNPEVPRGLERLILTLLSKSPDGRYASAGDLVLALRELRPELASLPSQAPLR